MTDSAEKILGGVAALLLVLVVGAVFGRLHGSDHTSIKALRDRGVRSTISAADYCCGTAGIFIHRGGLGFGSSGEALLSGAADVVSLACLDRLALWVVTVSMP